MLHGIRTCFSHFSNPCFQTVVVFFTKNRLLCLYAFRDYFVFLLLLIRKSLKPRRSFTLKMYSSVRVFCCSPIPDNELKSALSFLGARSTPCRQRDTSFVRRSKLERNYTGPTVGILRLVYVMLTCVWVAGRTS